VLFVVPGQTSIDFIVFIRVDLAEFVARFVNFFVSATHFD